MLIEEGHTGVRHLLAEYGWITYHIGSPDDYEHPRWLLRLSFPHHVGTPKKTPAGAEEFADVDGEVRGFEQILTGGRRYRCSQDRSANDRETVHRTV